MDKDVYFVAWMHAIPVLGLFAMAATALSKKGIRDPSVRYEMDFCLATGATAHVLYGLALVLL